MRHSQSSSKKEMYSNVVLPLSYLGSPQWLKKKKNAPVMQKTGVRSLGQEDPLEKEIATHSIILAREIPWTEEPGGLQSMGLQKSWTRLRDYATTTIVLMVTVHTY